MSRKNTIMPADFATLLADVKTRIQASQTQAVQAVNAELVRLYWEIGRLIDERQQQEGWGAAVIPRLSNELRNELPELKGFSERNIKRMLAFCREYPDPNEFVPQAVAQLTSPTKVSQPAAQLPASQKVQQPVALLAVEVSGKKALKKKPAKNPSKRKQRKEAGE